MNFSECVAGLKLFVIHMYKYLKIAGIIISIFCLMQSSLFATQFWIIPFVYTILISWYSGTNPGRGAGHYAIMIAMAGRYLLTPLSMYGTGELSTYAKQYSYLSEATALMVFEMIAVFITLYVVDKKYKKKLTAHFRVDSENQFPVIIFSASKLFLFLAFCIWIFIALFYKNLSGGIGVLVSGALNEMEEVEQVEYNASNIVGGIIWQTLCVWLYTYMIIKQKNNSINGINKITVYLSIVYTVILILLSFIDQTGLSRWFTIVMTGTSVTCLLRLFPASKNTILSTIVLPAAALIFIVTLFKNVGLILGDGTMGSAAIKLFDPSKMDTYFSGPVNVNNAIYVYKNYNLDFFTIIRDVCNNMPVVNHYMDIRATSVYAFNESIGRIFDNNVGDQIIPLVGQSMIYFGVIFAPMLSCISVLIFCWADYKFRICKSFYLFVYAFIAIWFGVESMMLNITIASSWVYNRIIPFVLAFWITNRAAGIKAHFMK